MTEPDEPLSLFRLLDPDVLANPYPLYAELRESAPVHWDPYLHAWVVTRYRDVVQVFQQFLAGRTPTPEKLAELGLGQLSPIARVMVRQMLFLDPPAHGRVRGIAAVAFTARRVAHLRERIQEVVDGLVDAVAARRPHGRDDRHRQPDAVHGDGRAARGSARGSRAAQGLVADLRRDARQFPAQPGPVGTSAGGRRGDDRLLPLGCAQAGVVADRGAGPRARRPPPSTAIASTRKRSSPTSS